MPGEKRLVAYLALQQGQPVGQAHSLLGDICGYLQDHLPAYMIPSVFIPLDALPLKPNGKVDRQALSTLEESNRLSLVNDWQPSQSVQPRDAIELQLVQIWEEVLQIQPVSILADFFMIGGHSLLAVRLMSRIAQHFGHHLDLATIFQHPKVAELAVVLRQQITSDERSPVVALQSQGSRPPFFCVHPAGGTAFCYVNLARYLGLDQPFYGLHAPDRSRCESVAGHGTLSTDCTTVEEMAAAYVAAIQEVQPQGPYLLGGWSLGGIIAFEMARQLQQQGEEVGLLAVIDSRLPSEQMRAQAGQKEIDLGDGRVARELIDLTGVSIPDDFDQREPHEQFSYAVEQTKRIHVFPVDTSPEFVRHFARTSLLNQHMMNVYVPQRYQHRIDYFVASASLEEMNSLGAKEDPVGGCGASPILQRQDHLQRWRELAGSIEVHLVPGNHQDVILQDANVRELAHALRCCIDRVCRC
jgi:thioesterase domain-containing protein